jgi:hypothetical protein
MGKRKGAELGREMTEEAEVESQGLFSETPLRREAKACAICAVGGGGGKQRERAGGPGISTGIEGRAAQANPKQKVKVGWSHRGMGSPAQIAETEKAFSGESEADQKPLD